MLNRRFRELVRASKASAAAWKAAGKQAFWLPPIDQGRQAVGEAGGDHGVIQGVALLYGLGRLEALLRQGRALQRDRRQPQGLGQRDLLFQHEGHERRKAYVATVTDDGTHDGHHRHGSRSNGPTGRNKAASGTSTATIISPSAVQAKTPEKRK